jgi:hypothetical protein
MKTLILNEKEVEMLLTILDLTIEADSKSSHMLDSASRMLDALGRVAQMGSADMKEKFSECVALRDEAQRKRKEETAILMSLRARLSMDVTNDN